MRRVGHRDSRIRWVVVEAARGTRDIRKTKEKVVGGGKIASQRNAGHLDLVSNTNATEAAIMSAIHSVGYCWVPNDSFSEPGGGGGVWLLQKSSPALQR